MSRKIYITFTDKKRLEQLIEEAVKLGATEDFSDLEKELERAEIVTSDKVPPKVVTMNSRVTIRFGEQEKRTFTLVYPKDANISEDKVSVLTPIGTAILGYSEGDEISWSVPNGEVKLVIEKILFQPEAAGFMDL